MLTSRKDGCRLTSEDIRQQIEKSLDLYDKTGDPEHLADVARWMEFGEGV